METLKQRAQLIMQYEQSMSKQQLENNSWHPKYIHLLMPANEVEEQLEDEEEAGVINGVRRLLVPLVADKTASEARLQRLEAKVDKLTELLEKATINAQDSYNASRQ